jgi:hypothetical protein
MKLIPGVTEEIDTPGQFFQPVKNFMQSSSVDFIGHVFI